jgi:hypothetical protein
MSYIRSGSNPEKLYIWGDGINFYIEEGFNDSKVIPKKIFIGLIKKWLKNNWEDTTFKDASVKEVWVTDDKTNEKESKIELSYDGWKIHMWLVTWVYITHTNNIK